MLPFRRPSRGLLSGSVGSECPNNNNSCALNETNNLDQSSSLGGNGRGNHGTPLPPNNVGELTEDLEDDTVGCANTFQSYCSEWEKLFMRRDYLKCIKSFGIKGGLRSSRFRSIAWKLFLGVLPEDQKLWSSKTEEWRKQYDDLKNTLIINPRNAEAKDLSINNPLSQEVESPWNQFFLDNELRLTIKQDVIRTYPDVPFFSEDRIHNMMIDILFNYGRKHSSIEYRQGMHELLAPLIFVLHCDHQAFLHACEMESVGELAKDILNPEFLEHDAYAMFSQVMQTAESWYVSREILPPLTKVKKDLTAQPFTRLEDVHPSNVIVTKLMHIQDDLLKNVDPELCDHLLKMDIAPQIYGIRWLRLLFGREFSMQDLLILWDAIFADDLTFSLVDYIFVAMLIYLKDTLLTSDYPSCLRLLMKYPPISDIQYFVKKALQLRNPHEFPNLITFYYKKPAESNLNGWDAAAATDQYVSGKRGSIKGSTLAQSLSSLTKIGLKRPGSLGLSALPNNVMSKSTSEPMNLITDTAVSPERVADQRKGSTASLSFIEGAMMQERRYMGGIRPNPSSQNLARFEQDPMSSSMVEQMSTASSDGANTSPRAGRFSFFGSRASRKSSVKTKPPLKNTDQDRDATAVSSYVSNIDSTCRRCAAELDFHIGTVQKFILKQNSFEENDEILMALAGIKQVRDVLKGVLKPSDMFTNAEVNYLVQSSGNFNHLYRKQQTSSAQSSLAATPLLETATEKFFVATPDLLSSDTDINSPDSGGIFPEANLIGKHGRNDTTVTQELPRSDCNFETSIRSRYSKDELVQLEAATKSNRKEIRKAGTPLEIKFNKSLPENVLLLNSEVEMIELQNEKDKAVHGLEQKSKELDSTERVPVAYTAEHKYAHSLVAAATEPRPAGVLGTSPFN